MSDKIQEHLINRQLLDPLVAFQGEGNDEILQNDELLALVAGVFDTSAKVIQAVIKERLKPIVLELIKSAHPGEVVVLRQAMIEVGYIYDDFEKYSTEYAKRKKEKEENEKLANELGTTAAP